MVENMLDALLKEAKVKEDDYVRLSLNNTDYPIYGYLIEISKQPVGTVVFDKGRGQWELGKKERFIQLSLYQKEAHENGHILMGNNVPQSYGIFFETDIKSIERIDLGDLAKL